MRERCKIFCVNLVDGSNNGEIEAMTAKTFGILLRIYGRFVFLLLYGLLVAAFTVWLLERLQRG